MKFIVFSIMILILSQTLLANECQYKTDYNPTITCSAEFFTANNQQDLDQYALDFGLINGKYRKLKINFSISDADIEIHSPCFIQLGAGNSLVVTGDICLDGREGVDIGINSALEAQNFTILSQNDGVNISASGVLNVGNLTLRGNKAVFINDSTVNVTGDVLLESLGTATTSEAELRAGTTVTAKNLTIRAVKNARVGNNNNLSILDHVLLESTGTYATSDAKIGSNTSINSNTLHLKSFKSSLIGTDNIINVTYWVKIESTGTSSGTSSELQQGAHVTTANLNIISGFLSKLNGSIQATVANHMHMEAPSCVISSTAVFSALTLTGSCFANPNDLPVPGQDQLELRTGTNIPLNFTLNAGTDIDGDQLYYVLDSGLSNGAITGCLNDTQSLSCIYTPDFNFSGNEIITYKAFDGFVLSSQVGTIQIAVNLPPVMMGNQSFVGTEDNSIIFTLNGATDFENDDLTYTIVSPPASGQIVNCLNGTNDLICEFIPAPDVNGPITFTYKANDGFNDSSNISMVTLQLLPVNDPPVMLGNQSFNLVEDEPTLITLQGGFDVDGDSLQYYFTSYPNIGRLENCLRGDGSLLCTYYPEPNFHGNVTFSYKATDGEYETSSVSVVNLVISTVNDSPVLPLNYQHVVLKNAIHAAVALPGATDVDSNILSYELVDSPSSGQLENCLGNTTDLVCDYTPAQDFVGEITFTYRTYDVISYSNVSTVKIIVNDPPVAQIIADSIQGRAPFEVQFSGNNSTDSDDGIVSYEWNFADQTISGDSVLAHTFYQSGQYSVSLKVKDSRGAEHTTSLLITVLPEDMPPTANFSVSALSGSAPLQVLFNAQSSSDDFGITSYHWDFAGLGTATGQSSSFTFTSNGIYNVTLTITDTIGQVATKQLSIIVGAPPCLGQQGSNHANGGGFVATTATVDASVYLGSEVEVCDEAKVLDQVRAEGRVLISNEAEVKESAFILGRPKKDGMRIEIRDQAIVDGQVKINDNVKVYGNAKVTGDSHLYGNAQIYGNSVLQFAEVYDEAKIYGQANLNGTGLIRPYDDVIVITDPQNPGRIGTGPGKNQKASVGRVNVYGNSQVYDNAIIKDDADISDHAKVYGSAEVSNSIVTGDANVFDFAKIQASVIGEMAFVGGAAQVSDYAQVIGSSVYENSLVRGSSVVSANENLRSLVYGQAIAEDDILLSGSKLYDSARLFGLAQVTNGSRIHGNAQVDYDVDGQDISSKKFERKE